MDFSYHQYHDMVSHILDTGKYKDYSEVIKGEPFVVLRHDVEFSPERAWKIAKLEHELGIGSSYFFQLRNHSYNMLSKENRDCARAIADMGHHVGLHVHSEGVTDIKTLGDMIKMDVRVLSDYLGIPIDRYSFHRPGKEILRANLQIDGLINVYESRFFHFMEHINHVDDLEIRYMADSMHRWNYGYPSKEILDTMDRIQILIHPYSWTEQGYDNRNNFSSLLREKQDGLKAIFNNETKHFREVANEV